MSTLPSTSDDRFESDILNSARPVVVEFGAVWCPPCRQLEPILEDLAGEWRGKVDFFQIDVDSNTATTVRYGVLGVPTLVLFKDGADVDRLTGYHPKGRIVDRLQPHLDLASA
jgi:thioredoxin 1